MQTCIFIPFIHPNTPKPYNLPQTDAKILRDRKYCWLPKDYQLEVLFESLT